jgi:hypothetical protein
MKCVVLQPSYIPWRGYFYQIKQADLFIFYDDIKFDKHGWRNRNRIRTETGRRWLSIPVYSKGVETNHTNINEIKICWTKAWDKSHWSLIKQEYDYAPFFDQYKDEISGFFQSHPILLSDFDIETTISLTRLMGNSRTQFMKTSELEGITGTKTDKLIQILQRVGADEYLSGPSAKDYVEQEKFDEAGIKIEYANYDFPVYPQLNTLFDPQLSILDLIFMTGPRAMEYF